MNTFARLRRLASLSAQEAADRLGVTKACVLHWEAGRCAPQVSRLSKIAALYGCSVADLIDAIEKESRPREKAP